jgi:cytochrome bd-type quinol oxidase subunit 2
MDDHVANLKERVKAEEDARNERVVRWHSILREQFGYAINLFLTFAIVSLGYCFSLLKDKDFIPGLVAKWAMIVAICSLVISLVIGGWCVVNRLISFGALIEYTRKASSWSPFPEELATARGKTWQLFRIQIITLMVVVAALAFSLLVAYGKKLG